MNQADRLLLEVAQKRLGRMIDSGEATSNPKLWRAIYAGWESLKKAKSDYIRRIRNGN